MKTNYQSDIQSNQSFEEINFSAKSKDSDDLNCLPLLNISSSNSNFSLHVGNEIRQRSLSEALIIKGRPSFEEKSFDTQSVKDNTNPHFIFKSILQSKNFLLKSEVCQQSSETKKLNAQEATPLLQYFYPSLIPKPEPKPILIQTQSQSIISQEGLIRSMNYIQKENIVKMDQCEQIVHDIRSTGSNGCYFQPQQMYSPFYPNDYCRFQTQYDNECYDKGNMNKYSTFDPSRGFQSQKGSINQIQMNNISASMCENYSNEILGELSIYLIKEQNGCKLLQKRVKQDKDFANNHLFPNLLKDICDLICDSFGNYLFQILFDYLSDENLSAVLSNIKSSFSKICMSPYGTRVIQSLLEIIKTKPELLNQLNSLLTPSLLSSLAEDPQGNYIIQKYIIEVPSPNNQFIYDAIRENFLDIAKTKQGCCTIQKCLKDSSKKQKDDLMDIIYKNMFTLITDQFGSYIFQYIIAKEAYDVQIKAINLVLPKLVSICKRKYSSNAIEKCFENTNEAIQGLLLKQLVENEQWIDELIVDSFGNYVIQKALMVSKGETYIKMLKIIARNIRKLKQVPFGNKLISILITKHRELGHIIANEQPCQPKGNVGENNASSPVYHYPYPNQNQNQNQNYNLRTNGYNLNQNKIAKSLKSS